MSGFLADAGLSANRIEQARQRAAQRGYIDLTSSNPTHQGLLFPPDILRVAADRYWTARRYAPDPRGLPMAHEAIAHYYRSRRTQTSEVLETSEVSVCRDIFITASTSEAYGLLFALLAGPGDNVLAPNVTYPLFEDLASIYRGG